MKLEKPLKSNSWVGSFIQPLLGLFQPCMQERVKEKSQIYPESVKTIQSLDTSKEKITMKPQNQPYPDGITINLIVKNPELLQSRKDILNVVSVTPTIRGGYSAYKVEVKIAYQANRDITQLSSQFIDNKNILDVNVPLIQLAVVDLDHFKKNYPEVLFIDRYRWDSEIAAPIIIVHVPEEARIKLTPECDKNILAIILPPEETRRLSY